MPFDLPSIKSFFTNASSARPEGDTPPPTRKNTGPLPNAAEVKEHSSQDSPRASRSSIGAPNTQIGQPEKKSWLSKLFSKNIYKKTDTSASHDVSPPPVFNKQAAPTSSLNAKFHSDTPESIQKFAKSTLELVNHYPFLAQNYAKAFEFLTKSLPSDQALTEIQQHINNAIKDQKSSARTGNSLNDQLIKLEDEVIRGGKEPPFSEEAALGILAGIEEHSNEFLMAEYFSPSGTSKVTNLGGQEFNTPPEMMDTAYGRRGKQENPFKPTLQIIKFAFPSNLEIQERCNMLLAKLPQ